MATKAKAKKATRKRSTKRAPAGKAHTIPNHRFAPGTKVGIYPAHEIGVERSLGREPIPSPTKTATVKKDGTVSVKGLKAGPYLAAAADDEGRYRYVQFSVK